MPRQNEAKILVRRLACLLGISTGLMLTGCQLFCIPDHVRVTDKIPRTPTVPGEVFFERWFTVEYLGGEVLLSSTPDGTGEIYADDALLIEVTHPDGTVVQRVLDFSFGCQGWISTLPAQNITSLFVQGRNEVHLKMYDICGDVYSCSELWLVVKCGRVISISPLASTWQWPVDNAQIIQGYANQNPNAGNKFHTGVDLRDSRVTCTPGEEGKCSVVRAAAAGQVVALCPNGSSCPGFSTTSDNHNMQGVVIIKHVLPMGRILYSLYAHLGKINPSLRVGDFINVGTILGSTGVYLRDGSWVSHVHFEIKDAPVLHNPRGGNPCLYDGVAGPCWGYTPGNPDDYGYHDPKELIGG